METILKLILVALFGSCLAGCAPAGGGSEAAARSLPGINESLDPSNPASPEFVMPVTGAQLTYYTLSKVSAPISGWSTKTVTLVGSCTTYKSKKYCWDNGVQTIPLWTSNHFDYGPFTYTYFNMQANPSLNHCFGGCSNDAMSTPTVVSDTLALNISFNVSPTYINTVFQTGTAATVTCTESNDILSCGDFTVDLNQTPY